MERRRGTRDDAIKYCSKQATRVEGPYTAGDPDDAPNPGKRSDLLELKSFIDGGKSLKEVSEEFFGTFLRYERSIRSYLGMHAEPRTWKTVTQVHWGRSGCGKTYAVWNQHERESIWTMGRSGGSGVWFDGYIGQDVALLDDFYGWVPLSIMLQLMDCYPCLLPIKGGFINWRPKFLYITSNKSWDEWYNWQEFGEEMKRAFRRRIDKIHHFDKPFE